MRIYFVYILMKFYGLNIVLIESTIESTIFR